MASRKIKINTSPVANNYAGTEEKIIEFSSPAGGGLISFRLRDDGKLGIDVYNYDPTVLVNVGKPNDAR